MIKDPSIFESFGVTVFLRDGRYYWMIKSNSFDTPEQAFNDAVKSLNIKSDNETPALYYPPGVRGGPFLEKTEKDGADND